MHLQYWHHLNHAVTENLKSNQEMIRVLLKKKEQRQTETQHNCDKTNKQKWNRLIFVVVVVNILYYKK